MYYTDDSDQLPPLPDCGPRDGKHGVDRDETYDPYPATRMGTTDGTELKVGVEDARKHLAILLLRVEMGEEVVIVQNGLPVARLVSASRRRRRVTSDGAEPTADLPAVPPRVRRKPKDAVKYVDHGAHLLELPDSGPRDGRHGVDRDRGFTPPGT